MLRDANFYLGTCVGAIVVYACWAVDYLLSKWLEKIRRARDAASVGTQDFLSRAIDAMRKVEDAAKIVSKNPSPENIAALEKAGEEADALRRARRRELGLEEEIVE